MFRSCKRAALVWSDFTGRWRRILRLTSSFGSAGKTVNERHWLCPSALLGTLHALEVRTLQPNAPSDRQAACSLCLGLMPRGLMQV